MNGKNASLFNAKRDINALEEICFEHKDPDCKTEICSRPTAATVSSDPPTSDPASDTLSYDPPTSAPPSFVPVTNRWACPITWVQRNIPPLSNDFAIFDDSPIKLISDLLNSEFWPNFRHGQSELQILFFAMVTQTYKLIFEMVTRAYKVVLTWSLSTTNFLFDMVTQHYKFLFWHGQSNLQTSFLPWPVSSTFFWHGHATQQIYLMTLSLFDMTFHPNVLYFSLTCSPSMPCGKWSQENRPTKDQNIHWETFQRVKSPDQRCL